MNRIREPIPRLVLVTAVALALAGCGTLEGRHETVGEVRRGPSDTAPLPPGSGPYEPYSRGQPLPPPAERTAMLPKTPEALGTSGAVLQLLRQAETEMKARRADQAAATLQRAQRIEPRNPFVWQALAQAYLAQQQANQAETTAQKSNSLARGNPYIEADNWRVIAAARQMRGDDAGSLQARSRAAEIERALP